MTLLYYDPIFLEHKTGTHPENPGRLLPVIRQLKLDAAGMRFDRPQWQPISTARLSRVHDLDYMGSVKAACELGGGNLDPDTVVSSRSYVAALMAAGAVCDAVERVLRGDDRNALCLVRPPGHHALSNQAMGFCLLNNVALGARLATGELGLSRVLVADWDVHHGNGTQAIFWEDPQVSYYSIHRWPFYPGTGAGDETGSGPGLGTTRNRPIEFGTPRADYLGHFADDLDRFAMELRPELVLISAGFDSHRADPIGSLGLESEDFDRLTKTVLDVAKRHCDSKVVSVLEGGYNPDVLAECVDIHLNQLLPRDGK